MYVYRIFDVLRVIEITDALYFNEPGAYLSDDQETRRILETLEAGFRWIRTENGLAIFELYGGVKVANVT